jgi:hypothetical protein
MKSSKKSQDLLLNQITSKIAHFNVMRCIFITFTLTFAVLLISACSVNGFQIPGVIPTETTIPTLTATPIPTATPDPFKDFAGKDCTNWEEPCPAKYSNWKSGLLLAYAKSIATPFSEEVMNTEFKMVNGKYPAFSRKYTFPNMEIMDGCTMTPELNPFKFVAHLYIPDAPGEPFARSHPGFFLMLRNIKIEMAVVDI